MTTSRGFVGDCLLGFAAAIGARVGWGLTTWIIGVLSSHVG